MRENYYRDSEPRKPRSLFEQYLMEAPGDEDAAPDITGPPDIPDETTNDPPPDISDEADAGGGTTDDDPPPDMGDDDVPDDFGTDDDTEANSNEDNDGEEKSKLGLDEKVSAIMNMNLYQRFITMHTKITTQIGAMKNNMDVLHSIAPDVIEIMESLNRLDENIIAYLNNNFSSENYSKNLLFFNKCLNLMKLLNDSFDKVIRKGIKEVK